MGPTVIFRSANTTGRTARSRDPGNDGGGTAPVAVAMSRAVSRFLLRNDWSAPASISSLAASLAPARAAAEPHSETTGRHLATMVHAT